MAKSKTQAEAHCQKLPVSKVLLCPRLSKAIAQILYWKEICKRLLHSQIGAKLLHQLTCKGGMTHQTEHLQLDMDKIQSCIQKAYKCYGTLKNEKNRCDTWLASLIDAQAMALKVTKNSLWKCIQRMEQIQTNARMIKKPLQSKTNDAV